MHIMKAHTGGLVGGQCQRLRTWGIGHLLLPVHQGKHLVQVGEVLFDFAVNHAQKIQRNVNLQHEGVHHHQVAQRHASLGHALGGQPQHGHQRHGNDELLPGIEQRQRAAAFELRQAQALQAFVVAACFKTFVVEVFDGFVVQQRVNGFAVCGRIKLVGRTAKLDAPLRHPHRVGHIQHQRAQGDDGKPHVKPTAQNGQHQQHLDEGGHQIEQRERHHGFNAAHAALNVARHAAGLALQVKAQAQAVQVLKRLQRNGACGAMRGLGKHQFAQLVEQRVSKAQQPIGQDQTHRHHQQRRGAARRQGHGVHQLFEQQRHPHRGEFGPHHEGDGGQHPALVLPQIRQQPRQRSGVRARGGCSRSVRRRRVVAAHGGQTGQQEKTQGSRPIVGRRRSIVLAQGLQASK